MNTYKITFERENGTTGSDNFAAATEAQARKEFKEVYRHGSRQITSIELISENAPATKEQERKPIEIIKNPNSEEMALFQPYYSQHNVIGFLKETFEDGTTVTRIILKMKPGYKGWTPSGTARDCGSYYIVARFSRYDRVDKGTLEIAKDVEDK